MTTAFDVVLKEIDQRRDTIAQALMSGSAKDYPEYRGMCGEIRGLSVTHNFITDLVRKMETNDD